MYLLDTNFCIHLISERSIRALEKLVSIESDEIAVSSVTVAELECGVAKSRARELNSKALDLFFAPMALLPFDREAARVYGRLSSELERRGKSIGGMDLMIAAHALSIRATLVTNTVRDFSHVRGLQIANWTLAKN